MEKNKYNKSEVKAVIKEEVAMFKKAVSLVKELENITKKLNEVSAGGPMAPGKDGVHAGQLTPKFEKLNATTLKEDGEDELDGDDMGGNTDATAEMSIESPEGTKSGSAKVVVNDDIMISKAEVEAAFKALQATLSLDLSDTSMDGMIDEVPGAEMEAEEADEAGEDEENSSEVEFGGEAGADESGETPAEEAGETPEEEAEEKEEDKIEECGEMPDSQALNEEKRRMAKLAGILKD